MPDKSEVKNRTIDAGPEKKRILFVFKSIPYPLRADGVSIRYLPIIEYMAQSHDVDLLIISKKAEESCNLDGLRPFSRKIFTLNDPRRSDATILKKCHTFANFLLPWTPPISVVSHMGAEVTRGIIEATKNERYDTVVCVGGFLLPNLMDAIPSMSVGKVFADFIDSPFLWVIRRKEKKFRIGLLNRYERWKTGRWEREVVRRVDGTIYISRVDAGAVPSGHALSGKRHVIPNGVSMPSGAETERAPLPSPSIGFLGTMGYPPNIEAVEWLYKEIFAPLRDVRSGLSLVVVGRYPSPSILALGKHPGVIVTGAVDDIWEYIRAIDVFVFPLLRGAGLKNKILEAMYGGRPVVTTEIGQEGIDATPGENIVLCRTSEEFRKEVIKLLDSPAERDRMGNSARAFVKEKFCWPPILSAYEDLLLGSR